MKRYSFGTILLAPALGVLALCLTTQNLFAGTRYAETDIVSDIPGRAAVTDPHLVNPWGMSFGPTTPIWSSNNGTGTATLYSNAGIANVLVATLRNAAGGTSPGGVPTGTVFNAFTTAAAPTFNRDNFLFATEDGTLQGWRGGIPTVPPAPANTAEILVNKSASGAVYKGMAISNVAAATNTIYATDFHHGYVYAHPNSGADFTFTDPGIPAGFAPFNVQNLGGKLYVTYAKQDGSDGDVAGPGNGYVSTFDLNGNFLARLISNGPLNSPWGVALAPAAFGPYGAGALLVGNFGDGKINVFNSTTGAHLDVLKNAAGNPIVIEGLWGIAFGNGAQGTSTSSLYFFAGIAGDGEVEDHGLFGKLVATTVADTTPPVVNWAVATPNSLGFPYGAMKPVTVTVNATDDFYPPPTSRILAISSNQAIVAGTDYSPSVPTAGLSISLLNVSGRTYCLQIETKDAAGNASTTWVKVSSGILPLPGSCP